VHLLTNKLNQAIITLGGKGTRLKSITKDIDFSELCITSKAEVNYENNIDVKVLTEKAKGTKCSMCWKINEKGCARSNCPQNS